MKRIVLGIFGLLLGPLLFAQTEQVVPLGIVLDWTHSHVLYPDSRNSSVMERIQRDPRWLQNWYRRHGAALWPQQMSKRRHSGHRDWSVSLGAAPLGPVFDFSFNLSPQIGFGSLNTSDQGNGEFLATSGSVTITAGSDLGTYPLYPGGPSPVISPMGAFIYDDLIYPSANPALDVDGLLFVGPGLEINYWGNPPTANSYSFYDYSGGNYGTQLNGTGNFSQVVDPGGGQTFPAMFMYDANGAPNCTSDFVAMGIQATPVSGGQANIIGVNNLYSGTAGAFCSSGPTVMFAYASGSGQVPAAIEISLSGSQLAYIENLTSGSSYLHVLTLGTTGANGTSATSAVVPGGGNNAVDQRVLLSPDGGITNQSSTNAVWVAYTPGDANDVAYATTYNSSGSGSGYLYKINNIFNGGTPSIVWSVGVNAIPSTPVYDPISNKVFFTDSNGRIDYVVDTGVSPSVVYGAILASGATSENPVVIDATNEMVYATFNSNGTNALVVQAPTSMVSSVSVAVGAAGTLYAAPYQPDFNNAWYTGTGTPLLYITGTGTGSLPTLYSVGFNNGTLNSTANATTAALATGAADSAPVTEFYNATLQKDFLFASVTNNCIATTDGGNGGCIVSLDITNGFPTVSANTIALAASGGTSGIIADNDSLLTGAANVYYATKTGATLVKATQSGLN